jgi:hypothetical protein
MQTTGVIGMSISDSDADAIVPSFLPDDVLNSYVWVDARLRLRALDPAPEGIFQIWAFFCDSRS